MPALQQPRGKPIYRSGRLFLIAGRCFRQTLNHTAAALFHPLGMPGSGSLPFLLIAKPLLMPTLISSHLRPPSKSPTSVVFGLVLRQPRPLARLRRGWPGAWVACAGPLTRFPHGGLPGYRPLALTQWAARAGLLERPEMLTSRHHQRAPGNSVSHRCRGAQNASAKMA